MKQTSISLWFALVLALAVSILPTAALAFDAGEAPKPGDVLPDVALAPSPRDNDVLGLPEGTERVLLSELPGRLLLIQSFSMYCPHCQKAAPDVNALYAALRANPRAAGLTMLGLGAGNSRYEVDFYQEQYQVPFALFPDQDMTFYACLHKPGTPAFVVLERSGPGLVVRFAHQGPFGDPEEFLGQLLPALGL